MENNNEEKLLKEEIEEKYEELNKEAAMAEEKDRTHEAAHTEAETEEKPVEKSSEREQTTHKNNTVRNRKIIAGFMIAIIAVIAAAVIFAFVSKHSKAPEGYWTIKSIDAGKIVMEQEDAEAIGLSKLGSIKLNKSGECIVTLMEEEYECTWTQAEDGTITIPYTNEAVLTATIDENGVMTAIDQTKVKYTLEK